MNPIPPSVVERLGFIQSQIWQTVSLTVSESSGTGITFQNPKAQAVRSSEIYSELSAPLMVIQFALAALPENSQIILLTPEAVSSLAGAISGVTTNDVDENIVDELRAPLESIVQGICLSIGNIKNETVVASGLSIRYQILSFPPNLQRVDELFRIQIEVGGEDVSGTAMWLMDSDTAHHILGIIANEEDQGSPFAQVGAGSQFVAGGGGNHGLHEEGNGLDLLMDIPLEISVELGRVKMLVREVVELSSGSIVEIDKAAGEPVDVMVNGRLVARGEVVVIEDNFGVRITEILTPQERLNRLGEVA